MTTTKNKTFHGYNVAINDNQYFLEYNPEAPKNSAWMLKEGTDIDGYCLLCTSTKRECISWIKSWNNID